MDSRGPLNNFPTIKKIHSKKHFNEKLMIKFGKFDIIGPLILSADEGIQNSYQKILLSGTKYYKKYCISPRVLLSCQTIHSSNLLSSK